MRLSEGTIVDATITNAPSSTKYREKKRDTDMHSPEEREPVLLRDEDPCRRFRQGDKAGP